jgi:two-component system, NarL family, response regulator LiaR
MTPAIGGRLTSPVGQPIFPNVKKIILAYGLLGGLLIAALKLLEYRFLVVEHSLEVYGGIVAVLFSVLGIWLGLKLTRRRETVIVKEVRVPIEVPVPSSRPFVVNAARQEQLRITRRELEILELMAAGLSNREMAERLYVSENTVKTHAGRVLEKLNAKRRTHAVQLAREAGLIP